MPTEEELQQQQQSQFTPEEPENSYTYNNPENDTAFSAYGPTANIYPDESSGQQSAQNNSYRPNVLNSYNSPDIASLTGGNPWGPGSRAFDRWQINKWDPNTMIYDNDGGPTYSGDEAELINSPRAKHGLRKFKRLLNELINQPGNVGQDINMLAFQLYEDHKTEKWMWASVPSIRSQRPIPNSIRNHRPASSKLFRWTNMYEVYKFKKGAKAVEKQEIPISVISNGQGPPIPAGLPYTSRFLFTYSIPPEKVTIQGSLQNPGVPYTVDIFQITDISTFNYNLANRIASIFIPTGNTRYQFDYDPTLGTNFIYALIEPGNVTAGVRSINFSDAKAYIGKDKVVPEFIYFRNHDKSVDWANFNSEIVKKLVGNFYP